MLKTVFNWNSFASSFICAPNKSVKKAKTVLESSIPLTTENKIKEAMQKNNNITVNNALVKNIQSSESTVVVNNKINTNQLNENQSAELNDIKLVDFSKPNPELEKVQEVCLEVALEVAKDGEGGLIVIGNAVKFEKHFPNFFEGQSINVRDRGMNKVLKKLAEIDGAVVVGTDGAIKAYGVRILEQAAQAGNGTRHSAAMGVSKDTNVLAILCSEEDKKVKLFRNSKQIAQINPFTKGVENNIYKVVNVVNKPEALIVAGSAIAAPLLGIALLPGVIIFSGSYYVAKNIMNFTQRTQQRISDQTPYRFSKNFDLFAEIKNK